MVEHSSQDQDGEYYRKMDVRLGHSRRDAVFGYLCWTWGVALVMLGSDTIQGKGMQFSEYFLRIFLQIVMRPSHGSSPEIFPLRYLQQVAAALLEPQLVSSRSHQRCSEHGRNGHLSSKPCTEMLNINLKDLTLWWLGVTPDGHELANTAVSVTYCRILNSLCLSPRF